MAKSVALSSDSFALLVLRVVFGALMILEHGWGKLMSYAERSSSFPDPLGVGSQMSLNLALFGEVVAPALLVVGLGTRLAAIPAAFTMAVACFVVHAGDPIGDREMSALYLAAFSAIALLGGGGLSLDAILSKSLPGWMRVLIGQPR